LHAAEHIGISGRAIGPTGPASPTSLTSLTTLTRSAAYDTLRAPDSTADAMTKLRYDATHWTPHSNVFQARDLRHGPLAVWQAAQTFGGSSAYALLGPDIERPAGRTHNPPSAVGPGWNAAWNHAPPVGAGPNLSFTQDAANVWYRGHLINGEWSGSGTQWSNLTPLTSQANANHRFVEGRMRVYLQNFRAFNEMGSGHQTYWYALKYWVQVATAPWSAVPAAGDLYSYCPNMIKVTWRVVTINKPMGGMGGTAMAALAAAGAAIDIAVKTPAGAGGIAMDLPNIPLHNVPAALTLNVANLADMGGGVHPLPPGAPLIHGVNSNYDGEVEIFQN
jgi:hypothetical protein